MTDKYFSHVAPIREISREQFASILETDFLLTGSCYEWGVANSYVLEHYRLDPLKIRLAADGSHYLYPSDDPRKLVRLDRESVVRQSRENLPIARVPTMPDPIQSLSDIAERCRATAKACNPSKIPTAIDDLADVCEILQQVIRRLDEREQREQS